MLLARKQSQHDVSPVSPGTALVGFRACLQGDTLYLVGPPTAAPLSLLADRLVAVDGGADTVVVERHEPATVTLRDGRVVRGRLLTSPDRGLPVALVPYDDREQMEHTFSEFASVSARSIPRHTLLPAGAATGARPARYRAEFDGRLTYRVVTQICQSTLALTQAIALSSTLPYDLVDLQDLTISFLGNERRTLGSMGESFVEDAPRGMRARAAAAPRAAIAESATLGAPLHLGRVPLLKRNTTMCVPLPVQTTLELLDVYLAYDLTGGDGGDGGYVTLEAEVRPVGGPVYPADATITDEHGLPVGRVRLALRTGVFTLCLGRHPGVRVREVRTGPNQLHLEVLSSLDQLMAFVVRGYRVGPNRHTLQRTTNEQAIPVPIIIPEKENE